MNWSPRVYENMLTNNTLADLYTQNAEVLGIKLEEDPEKAASPTGSTDMGNVSHVVPSIHPMFYIGTQAANHTRDFTTAAGKGLSRSNLTPHPKIKKKNSCPRDSGPMVLQYVHYTYR